MSDNVSIPLEITKRDDDRRIVFGFAKFSEDPNNRGYYYIDKQGDVITTEDLENSAYEYALTSRSSGTMHVQKGVGNLVESVVVTPEKLDAWGLEPDAVPVAWWVGYHVGEVEEGQPDPFESIKKGEYLGFSVEGTAFREDVEKANPTGSMLHQDKPLGPASDEEEEEEEEKKKKDDEEEDEVDKRDAESTKIQKKFEAALTDPSLPAGDLDTIQEELWDSEHLFPVTKHEGEDHPQSSHGNRLFSEGTDPIGKLMKRLKTRYKRTDAATLRNLQKKFASAKGPKDAIAHDEIVLEMVRRNLIKPAAMKFKSDEFQKKRENIVRAVTEELA